MQSKSFFERVDLVPRIHWKNVAQYKVFSPEISRGDASFVYYSELSTNTNKKCAIKSYPRQWMEDNGGILANELNCFKTLSNLGILPTVESEPLMTSRNIYYAMEICNAGSLDLYIKNKKVFPVEIIREIAIFISNALLQLQGVHILHREINPRHILANIDDATKKVTYKLIGLQFCKNISNEKAHSFVGTAEYISPEAAMEQPYDYSADIWSFGITLYELAVGATSLKIDPNFRARIKAGSKPLLPQEIKIPETLYDLICKCIVFNPKDRITASGILSHPFITGSSIPEPMVIPEHQKLPPVKPHEEEFLAEQKIQPLPASPPKAQPGAGIIKPKRFTKKLSDKELVLMISKNFADYMEYVNDTENHKIQLKCEKRLSLDPYIKDKPTPENRGGFSEIYFATREKTKEKFALKRVLTSKMTDVKIANLLLGEIEIMLDLSDSPFAIHIEDYFVFENDLWLVLELCNGGDLDNYIRFTLKKLREVNKEFPLEEIKLIAWNVACGLRDMHRKNMMHRDIKPKNILVVKDPDNGNLLDIKLCDYGLSKKVAEYESLIGSTILGTFDYFAPELYEMMEKRMAGDNSKIAYDFKIDVWSYGVLLYFTVYGKSILEPPGSKYSVMRQKNIIYPSLKGVPESYINLIKRCLTFDPIKRPSFNELLNDPFFTTVALHQRPKMLPFLQGKFIGDGANEKIKIYECTKGKKVYSMKVLGSGAMDEKSLNREIDTLAKLKNGENIIRMQDYFAMGSNTYIIIDSYDSNLLKYSFTHETKKQPLSEDQQILVAYGVINAINDIHGHNIIHRNIHPQSVFLSLNLDGSIKKAVVGEFGFARVLLDNPATTELSTPYNAPENVLIDLGVPTSYYSDIWSYGMFLYYLIFGVHINDVPGNDTKQIWRTNKFRYDEKRAAASPQLFGLMGECMQIDAKKRPTAAEILKKPIFSKFVKGTD